MDVEAAAEAAEELRRLVHAESFPTGNGPPFSLAVAERGGVVSASVAETNRLRASLGLKPLAVNQPAEGASKDSHATLGKAAAGAQAAAAELSARTAHAREKRTADAALRTTASIADCPHESAAAWAQRHAKAAALSAAGAPGVVGAVAEADAEGDAGDGACASGLLVDPVSLAGLAEGDTVVLTLADAHVLDEGDGEGGGAPVVESVRATELERRAATRAAAVKVPSGAGGDATAKAAGATRAPLALDAAAQQASRDAAVRARLAAAAAARAAADACAPPDGGGDFFTAEEVAAATACAKPLRRKRRRAPRPLAADELQPLDAPGMGPLGAEANAGTLPPPAAAMDAGWVSFAAAKAKAAARAAMLLGTSVADARHPNAAGEAGERQGGDTDAEAEDAALSAVLDRSRRAALAASAGAPADAAAARLAAEAGARRTADGEAALAPAFAPTGGAVLTDTAEFVRTVALARPAPVRARDEAAEAGAAVGADGSAGWDTAPPRAQPRRAYRARPAAAEGGDGDGDGGGGIGAATAASGAAEAHDAGTAPSGGGPAAEADALPGLRPAPAASGRGLAATLALLKETGSLMQAVTWAGRSNDKKPHAVAGAVAAAAVETGGGEYDFGFKLDRFDEFGRKMTPKEAFRELCHKFHGIFPSKSKQEARLKQWHEEQAALKQAAGDTPLAAAERMRQQQARTATPFVVLSGRVKSAQVTDAQSRYATAEQRDVPAEMQLGGPPALGSAPPLVGAEKVCFMLARSGDPTDGADGAGRVAKRQREA